MPRTSVPLAGIRETSTRPRITRSGLTRPECWGAETIDGIWEFEREESSGTPWLMYHKPSVADGSYPLPARYCGTLRECRALVASGGAAQELAYRKADPDTARLVALLATQKAG